MRISTRRADRGSIHRCAAAALLGLAALVGPEWVAGMSSVARAEDASAAAVVAGQIRRQGFPCEEPAKAERDTKASSPNEAVWSLHCKGASYRVRLVPDQAAKVERIDEKKQ
jgi:hypothetical protein